MLIDAQTELANIKERAIEIISQLHNQNRTCLLSGLGSALGADRKRIKELTGGNVLDFTKNFLGEEFDIVLIGPHGNVHALVPKGTSEDTTSPSLPQSNSGSPRYHYRFWAAFSVLPVKGRRYFDTINFLFRDEEAEDFIPTPSQIYVANELVPPSDAADRDKKIADNIKTWLADNKQDEAKYLAKSNQHLKPSIRTASRSVLEILLDALDAKQLQSTTMTLDAVATLAKRKV